MGLFGGGRVPRALVRRIYDLNKPVGQDGFPMSWAPCAGKLVMPEQLFYTGSESTITYRSVHLCTLPTTVIRLMWHNVANSGVAGNPFTLTASIQGVPTTGTNIGSVALKQITFNGNASVVVPDKGYVISDPIWLNLKPTAGAYFLVRSAITSAAANGQNKWPVGPVLAGGNNGIVNGTDETMNLSATFVSGSTGVAPSLITTPQIGKLTSFLGSGDSIMDGSNDVTTNRGYFGMFIENNLLSGNRIAVPGEQLNFVVGAADMIKHRWVHGQAATHVINSYGTNDIYAGLLSLAAIQANLITWWSYWTLMGKKVIQTTILPRTTSTDSWRTVANQSVINGSGQETIRVALNQWLRAGAPCTVSGFAVTAVAVGTPGAVPCPYLSQVADLCSIVEVNASNVLTQDGGRWMVGGVLRSATATGGSTSTILDTAGNFASIPVVGTMVYITGGTGSGQARWVVGNPSGSNTQLNTTPNWTTAPDATSTYQIIDVTTSDGIHPVTAAHILFSTYLTSQFLPGWKMDF
jgi:hypothetical protein